MARRYGRAPRGKRLRAGIPHGHWKTTTFVAGLRLSGMVAPMVLDGPINGVAPTLKPGDIVIMDNLGSHKGSGVREAIEAAGASLIFLPPSRSSRPFFARLLHALSKAFGPLSENSSPPSRQLNAQTTSPQQDMMQYDRIPL